MAETVDDFSDGDLSEYSGLTDEFFIQGGVLGKTLEGVGGSSNSVIASTSGLPNYPVRGDVYAVEARFIDDGSSERGAPEMGFGAINSDRMYLMSLAGPSNSIRIRDAGINQGSTDSGEPVELSETTVSLTEDEWYDCRLVMGGASQQSNFVFEQGEAIAIGDSGDHDLAYEEGTAIPSDSAASGFVREQGSPLGSVGDTFTFELYDSPSSTSPLATVSQDLPGYEADAGGGIGFRSANGSEESERWRNARILG